jgi:hypothetical protein
MILFRQVMPYGILFAVIKKAIIGQPVCCRAVQGHDYAKVDKQTMNEYFRAGGYYARNKRGFEEIGQRIPI